MADTAGTTMVNPIRVTGDRGRFLEIIKLISDYMATRDGFVALRFLKSHEHDDRYCMVAEWASLDAHQAAADERSAEVLSWFAELRGLTEVAPLFYDTVDSRRVQA